MGETLEEGLNALFGSGGTAQTPTSVQDSLSALGVAPPPVGGTTAPATAQPAISGATADLLRQAQAHYDRAIAAQRAGNWTEYGREIDQLGATIRALRAAQH
jgi:uncharacterized membrane protein (UPF0182 family)